MPPPSSLSCPTEDGTPTAAASSHRRKKPVAPAATSRLIEFLKTWRQDALNKHQYDAAGFVGDKLLALTSEYGSFFQIQ
jgi:hypothetical protein